MKIFYATDIHSHINIIEHIPHIEFDLVILGGDITDFGSPDEGKKILRKIFKKTGCPVLFVPGNCDPPQLSTVKIGNDIQSIHGRILVYDGIPIGGLGGSNITPFYTPFEWPENDAKESLNQLIGKLHDGIFVSHTPPFGTKLDITFSGKHVGSKSIREFILREKPRLVLTGHIHEALGKEYLDDVIIVNPGPFNNGYYAIITFEKSSIEISLLTI